MNSRLIASFQSTVSKFTEKISQLEKNHKVLKNSSLQPPSAASGCSPSPSSTSLCSSVAKLSLYPHDPKASLDPPVSSSSHCPVPMHLFKVRPRSYSHEHFICSLDEG